jgi:mono/diheme cytochrome c family protein
MLKRHYQYGLALMLTLGLMSTFPAAESKHGHDGKHDHHGEQKGGHGDQKGYDGRQGHAHRHAQWEPPPAAYADMRGDRWTDAAAASRGKTLFMTNCMVCHGADGKGAGPAAKGLPHAPADLTNHFHNKPGDGDAYLFWRVSEGGMVEPFKSMKSTMPAFKTVLSEDQRWDVLAYVHTQFHKGFKSETMPKSVTGEGTIIAVVPDSKQVVVDHQAIKGFRDAMIMGYKVHPTSLLHEVQAGDQVRFTIDTQQNTIVKIEKMKQ